MPSACTATRAPTNSPSCTADAPIFFYQILSDNDVDDEHVKFTDDQLNSYIEEIEWLDFAIGLENESEAFARAAELRNMAPTNLRDV